MPRFRARSTRAVALLSLLALAVGCSRPMRRQGSPPATGVQQITEAQIARSAAATVWDVLRHESPQLNLRERSSGQPASLGRRGRASIHLNDPPLVFIDGVRTPDFRVLDQIPANTVSVIYVLTGIEGTTYYGTNAVSGVVLVHTKKGT